MEATLPPPITEYVASVSQAAPINEYVAQVSEVLPPAQSHQALSPAWPAGIQQWKTLIETHAATNGLDPDLVAAVMTVESGGRQSAVSTSNAQSLMQVMPRESGYPGRPTVSQLKDPSTNILWGCKILASGIRTAGTPWGPRGGCARYYGLNKVKTAWYAEEVYRIYNIYN